MPAPHNPFKAALKNGETVIGCWLSLGDPIATEIAGTAGFDWLLVDGEHTPYDITRIRMQLMALEASDSHAAVRVPISETWILKQALDAGAQTILVPMVETADQARQLVHDVRYPPTGGRGVGYSGARCSRYGEITDYGSTADDQICLPLYHRRGDALQLGGVVAAVSVQKNNNVTVADRIRSRPTGRAVTLTRFMNDAGAGRSRLFCGTIGGAVVHYNDFLGLVLRDGTNHLSDSRRFIVGRDDDGNIHCFDSRLS